MDILNFTIEQKIENCRTFLRYWETIPDENISVDLTNFREDSYPRNTPATCNTIACAGGWLPAMPEFAALGISWAASGSPNIETEDSKISSWRTLAYLLFGSHTIFNTMDNTGELTNDDCTLRPKVVVTNRFKKAIFDLTVLSTLIKQGKFV